MSIFEAVSNTATICYEATVDFMSSCCPTGDRGNTSSTQSKSALDEKTDQVASAIIPSSQSMGGRNNVAPIHGSQSMPNLSAKGRSSSTDSFSSVRSLPKDEILDLKSLSYEGLRRRQLKATDPALYNLYQKGSPMSPILFSEDKYGDLFRPSPYSDDRSQSKED